MFAHCIVILLETKAPKILKKITRKKRGRGSKSKTKRGQGKRKRKTTTKNRG
jgi:hypothetical protein